MNWGCFIKILNHTLKCENIKSIYFNTQRILKDLACDN